jgi:Amino acid permease/pfkB family carbohydrate kinase
MTSPALGPVAVLGAHILDVLGRPVETIPPGQGSLRLAEIRATAAGTAAGTAVDLAKLGASVLSIGALGDDLLGDMVVAAMARHRVDVSGLSRKRGAQTSATILPIRANGERPALHVPGATPLLDLADLDLDRITRSRALLIGAPDALGPVLDDLPQVVKGVKVFVAFVIFSMFAILVVGSGAQARLVYSMSRDNMLPFSGTLRRINIRSQTPIIALLVFGVIDLGVMIYGYFQTSAFGTLVGATAIIPYIIYFLITLAYALKRRTLDSIPGAFTLGRWAWPVIGFVLVYTVVVMLVLSLPAPFHGADKVLGYGLALAAAWYFGGLLWRLRKGTAGVKPVEDLVDAPRP